MDILSLNKINIKHLERLEHTDRLYFDQYRYSFKLMIKDFSCLREMRNTTKTQSEVEIIVAKRFAKRLSYDRFWIYTPTFDSPANLKSEQTATRMRLNDLMDILNVLWPARDQIKIVFSGDWGYIYSNDKGLLAQINKLHYVTGYYIKEAVVSKPKNTVVLKSSPYQFRSYFRSKQYTQDEKTRLLDYLENQPDIKISQGLTYWLKYSNYCWSRRHHYFDHNDAKIELMLRLIFPDLIRNTMPIIEVNN